MKGPDPIRLVHWGLGEAGLAAARLVRRRPGIVAAGAISAEPDHDHSGQDLGDLLGFGERLAIPVDSDPRAVLFRTRPDVTVIAAASEFELIAPMVVQAMEAGSNVICLADEMIYPWGTHSELAEKLDELAYAHGVTVLGIGVSAGFSMDTLSIALTGCCADVERIRVTRVGRIERDPHAHGLGLSPSAYAEQHSIARRSRRRGLEQAAHLIADSLGWNLDRVDVHHSPHIAEVRRQGQELRIEPGQVSGFAESAMGYVDGRARILLEHHSHFMPEVEAVETADVIEIEGQPKFQATISPTVASDQGVAAVALNMITAVLQSGPGLKTVADMPLPRAVLADLREMMTLKGPTIEEELAGGWHQPGLESP